MSKNREKRKFLFCRDVANATSSWSQNFSRVGKTSISVNVVPLTFVKFRMAKIASHCYQVLNREGK